MTDLSEQTEAKNDKSNKNKTGTKKNLTIICLIFLGVFTSTNAVNNLQSSIHVDSDIGLYSLSFLTAGSMFASLVLSTPLMFLFGYKWNIVAGQVAMLAYIAANMYPVAALLYPSNCIDESWKILINRFV